jgi:hypothetical protein
MRSSHVCRKLKLKTSLKPKKACWAGRLNAKPVEDICKVDMPLNPKFLGRQRFNSSLSIVAP